MASPQVNVKYDEVSNDIKVRQYQPTPDNEVLDEIRRISDVWPEQPAVDDLHIVVNLSPPCAIPSMYLFFSSGTWAIK